LIELYQNITGSGFLRHRRSSRYCSYGNHAAGGYSVPKIINERCELVKLCHINRSGPVFYRASAH